MLHCNLRDLVSDYETAVKKEGLGLESSGVCYVHETLAQAWIHRVLTDALLNLVTELGIEDSGVAVVLVDEPEDPEEAFDDLEELDE